MTKKASSSTTFGDESVESVETAPVETVTEESTDDAVGDAAPEPTPEAAPEADEATEAAPEGPKTWPEYEAKLRDDLDGFIVGRQIESAVRYAKGAWDAAKASQ